MKEVKRERTCGNCVFCLSDSVMQTFGFCAMHKDKKGEKELVQKGDTAEKKECKNHLYKASYIKG